MDEKLFVIEESKLTQLIDLLNDAPHRWVEYPILILKNLDQLKIEESIEPDGEKQLLEG
jgi:hypothetical protein